MFKDTPDDRRLHNEGDNLHPTGAVTIRIDIRELKRITMNVFDVSGRLQTTIIETVLPAGKHSITWNRTDEDGGTLPAGKYMLLVHISDQPVDYAKLLLL